MDKDKVIKRIKLLNRRIEIREEKKFKMVSPVSKYDWYRWKCWEYEISIAEEELEKLLKDNYNIDIFYWNLYPDKKESILYGKA